MDTDIDSVCDAFAEGARFDSLPAVCRAYEQLRVLVDGKHALCKSQGQTPNLLSLSVLCSKHPGGQCVYVRLTAPRSPARSPWYEDPSGAA